MNLGILIIMTTFLGYFSNWLNGKFLNNKFVRWLYYFGAIVHESSHALMCILTGAKITEFKIFSKQPHVSHLKPRLFLIGQPLISLAPIIGGLFFIYSVNHWLLGDYFSVAPLYNIKEISDTVLYTLAQFNFTSWQSWVMTLLLINTGAMIGPSTKDLKNIWPVLILLLFVDWQTLINVCLVTISLITINIIIQIIIIAIRQFLKLIPKN